MSTTTIRIPDDLKARVTSAAKNAGTTPHNFILQAISEKTASAELQKDFNEDADKRYADIISTGETISWPLMRSYLEERMAGKQTLFDPLPKSWRAKGGTN